jgi:cyclophilin family peptidyl-prolyl cis-trans isomerase
MRTTMSSLFVALGLLGSVAAVMGATGKPEAPEPEPKATHTAVIKTSLGDIELELYGDDAPKTVANFVGLAGKNFFNDILFHRVVPGFVIQAGDPKTKNDSLRAQWGTGGESIYNGEFADELNPNAPSYKRGYVEGTLAMANHGPNTNSSQFFIMLGETPLPKLYSIFGKVTKGLDIVHKIENVELAGSQPKVPVKIISVTAKKKDAPGHEGHNH